MEATVEKICEGCETPMQGAGLCASCTERSLRVDRALVGVSANDPVACDGCKIGVDYDARLAVVIRECGGTVLCDHCKPASIEGEALS